MIDRFGAVKGFRDDINALRAVAVLVVVLFHFGVPGFSGGFIGVDIFFVISGFLMMKIIILGVESKNFSLINFYLDRARRIIPALVVLCAVLLLVGWFFLPSKNYQQLGAHAAASIAFFSNFKYWKETGYFDGGSHEKWLLHTWSLSVEWQFYILLPLGVLIIWKLFGPRAVKWALIGVGICSLALSIFITQRSPSGAFYLIPTRAWEMLAGGLVWWATRGHTRFDARLSNYLVTAGLIIIAISIAAFDATSVWPGASAIWPVVGTMFVLAGNRQGLPILSSWWIQRLGNSSYSIYLWHWPFVVVLAYARLDSSWVLIVAGIFLSIVVGEVSLRLIETPARVKLKLFSRANQVGAILGGAVIVASLGALVAFKSFPGRIPEEVERVSAAAYDMDPRAEQCWESTDGRTTPICFYGAGNLAAIMIGDSHAGATVTAFAEATRIESGGGVSLFGKKGCPTLTFAKRDGYECDDFNAWMLKATAEIPPEIPAVIVNRTTSYIYGLLDNESPKSLVGVPIIYFDKKGEAATLSFQEKFKADLISTACTLAQARTVYLVRPIPEMGVDVPRTMSLSLLFGGRNADISVSLEGYHRRHAFVWEAQDEAVRRCGVKILDPLPFLCDQDRCWGSKAGQPLYFDDDHLNEFGNKLLVPMFRQVFSEGRG